MARFELAVYLASRERRTVAVPLDDPEAAVEVLAEALGARSLARRWVDLAYLAVHGAGR